MTTGGFRADEAGGQDTQRRVVCVTIDAPPQYQVKAAYAIEALLTPMGFDVLFDALRDDALRIHYGLHRQDADLHLPMHPNSSVFFDAPRFSDDPVFESVEVDGEETPAGFVTPDGPDFVASAFYWLSGWSEYTREDRDEHGRVTWEGSVQQRLGSRAEPYVDRYRRAIHHWLSDAGHAGRTEAGRWHFCITHDIDYLFKWSPGIVIRTIRRLLAEPDFRRRFRLRANPILDASYRMLEHAQHAGGHSTWLFKGSADDPRDVEYSLTSRRARRFIAKLRETGMEVGLHPAYRSFTDSGRICAEKERVEDASGEAVRSSRQHYLRTDLPRSARALLEAGIRIDSTLGFPDAPGYRNGTTLPFNVFDVEANAPLGLVGLPLAFMDASLFNRQGLSVDAAVQESRFAMEAARRYGGVCVGLWHNVLWDEGDYPGWGEHFERCLALAVEMDARLSTLSEAEAAYRPSRSSIRTTSV